TRARKGRAVCDWALIVSRLHRRDYFLYQPAEPSHIAAGIHAVAEPHHDEALRRHDHDALAQVAGRKERVAGNAKPHARFGVGVLAAIGPEAGGVIGVERRGRAEIDPVLMQDALSPDHAVIEVEQAE